ncbi:tetratricopeptide repeat protein, partial [Candidatus Dependentiae bacterium]|nr:tetratricopeptide repeat protein [Candidatus Dependentiae bacterium]
MLGFTLRDAWRSRMNIGKQQMKKSDLHNSVNQAQKKVVENGTPLLWYWSVVPPVVLSVLTFLFYYPSLSYPFQFDDLANISKKFEIRFFDLGDHLFKYSRWVGEVLNRLNYKMGEYFRYGGGGFDPFYYRLVNVFLHIATGLMVFVLFRRLFSRLSEKSFLKKYADAIAALTTGLFLLHPVQTQTVSYVIQARLEGMATLFVLVVLWLMVKSFELETVWKKYFFQVCALFVAFVSCGTKEIVIVLPLLSVLVDLFFFAKGDVKKVFKNWFFHLVLGLVVLITLMKYINPDFFMQIVGMKASVANNRGNVLSGSYSQMITPWKFLISEFKVILHYLAIYFAPFKLSVEYDWVLVKSFFSADCILPLCALLMLIAFAIYRWVKDKLSMYTFSLAWFLIAVAPRSTIMPSPELICDYKSYLASIGIFVGMAIVIIKLYELACEYELFSANVFTRRSQTMAFSFLCMIGLGFSAYSRNLVWESTVSFWLNIVERAPNKARGHNNLGVALSESGRYEEASPYFFKAITLDKFYSDPWSNAAVVFSVKGDNDRAISCLKEAVKLNPEYAEAHNNLGSLCLNKGDYEASEMYLKNAIL